MRGRVPYFGLLLAVALMANPAFGVSAANTVTAIDIGKNEIGAPPAQFELPPLSDAKQRSWTVVRDASANGGVAIEHAGKQPAEDRPPLAIYKPAAVKNAEINLRLNATGGISSRGGGVAVRLASPQDYYLVQLDALRDRVLFSLVHAGTSEEIVGVDADIASHAWHTLSVRTKDDEFVVSLDGTWTFTAFDNTIPQAGRIALWTEGDSITRFDSISIIPLQMSGERH